MLYNATTYSSEFSANVGNQMQALANTNPEEQVSGPDPAPGESIKYNFGHAATKFARTMGLYGNNQNLHLTEARSSIVPLDVDPIALSGSIDEATLAQYSLLRVDQIWQYALEVRGMHTRLGNYTIARTYGLTNPDSKPVPLTETPAANRPKEDRIRRSLFHGPIQHIHELAQRKQDSVFLRQAQGQDALGHLIPVFQAFGMEPDYLLPLIKHTGDINS